MGPTPTVNCYDPLPSRPQNYRHPSGYVQDSGAAERRGSGHVHGEGADAVGAEGLFAKLGRWVEGINEKLADVAGRQDDSERT
jgi:hypothetical protein